METKTTSYAVPAAIIIAGVVVAGAIVWSIGKSSGPQAASAVDTVTGSFEAMAPVGPNDHVRGAAKAPITIVEYSDTECPFCKRFHMTMQDVMKKYDGKVAWVYRHFPIKELHAKAFDEAKATECAAKIGGKDMFWPYIDAVYSATPSNDQLDPAELTRIAANLKIDAAKFAACQASPDVEKKINDERDNAIATGGNGTPWSILVGPDGTKYAINGAQPIEEISKLVDMVLKK